MIGLFAMQEKKYNKQRKRDKFSASLQICRGARRYVFLNIDIC